MIGTQLDLFGGLPKPPKKITIDEEPEPVASVPETPLEEPEPIKEQETPQVGQSAAVHVQMPMGPTPDAPGIIEVASDNMELPVLAFDSILVSHEEEVVVSENIETELPTTEVDFEAVIEGIEEVAETIESVHPATVAEIEDSLEGKEDISENIEAEGFTTEEEVEVFEDQILLPEVLDTQISSKNPNDVSSDDTTETSTEEKGLNIPEDQILYSRQYYTMRETSAMFQVNQSLLRFWENEFDILKPKKNRKGDRYFRPDDIKNLELIYHLLRVRKFTINGAKDYLKSRAKALDTFEMVQRLERMKAFLLELKTNL